MRKSKAPIVIRLVVLLALGGLIVKPLLADENDGACRLWDFESETVGRLPSGLMSLVGNWQVTAEGQNRVLAQTARSDDSVFNLLLCPDVLYSNVEVSVRLKAVKGIVDQGGGLVWRAKNAQTYYLGRYNPLEDSFRVYKVIDGKRTQLGSIKAPGDLEWHILRVTMKGNQIRCVLDDKIQIEIEDDSIRGYGRIGLWSKSDAQSLFDDLNAQGDSFVPKPIGASTETKQFEVKNDRAFLGGHPIDLWGLRCGNAFYSDAVTERYIRNFDNMNDHGINLIGASIQGADGGYPNGDSGLNGFTRHGKLLSEVGRRIEWMVREADKRGMVVVLDVISPRKNQSFYDDAGIQMALEETARFLKEKSLKNVFVNLCDEFDHPLNANNLLIREPDGVRKKAQLTSWFKAIAPEIEAGIGTHRKSDAANSYPDMDFQIIQKGMPIPKQGFVINFDPTCEDVFQNDGIFNQTNVEAVFKHCRDYLDAQNAVFMFHACYAQGVTNFSGTAPHAEMGGYGTRSTNRGIRFYYEWVRDNVGRWKYPNHVPAVEFSIKPQGE